MLVKGIEHICSGKQMGSNDRPSWQQSRAFWLKSRGMGLDPGRLAQDEPGEKPRSSILCGLSNSAIVFFFVPAASYRRPAHESAHFHAVGPRPRHPANPRLPGESGDPIGVLSRSSQFLCSREMFQLRGL
jgi:hypothetical protein